VTVINEKEIHSQKFRPRFVSVTAMSKRRSYGSHFAGLEVSASTKARNGPGGLASLPGNKYIPH